MTRDLGMLFCEEHELQMMKKQWTKTEGSATHRVVLELELGKQCNYGGVVND